MSAVELRSVTKAFGATTALVDLSLTIEEERIVALVGGNGAGKTTLLRLLATLLRPTSGHAFVCGFDTSRSGGEVRRLVGYVPDSFGLYGDLKVREYLEFFAECFGMRQAMGTISELLHLVDLYGQRDDYIATLSRGMRQRLLLARALIHDPRLLLLDEPGSGLDPRGRDDLLEILRELRALGKTIVIATHLLGDVTRLCTDVAVLADGRVAMAGPTADLIHEIPGPRRMRVQVVNDPELARQALELLPSVREVSVDGQSLGFLFDGSRYDLPEVLERLVHDRVKVMTFAEEEDGLATLLAHVLQAPPVGASL